MVCQYPVVQPASQYTPRTAKGGNSGEHSTAFNNRVLDLKLYHGSREDIAWSSNVSDQSDETEKHKKSPSSDGTHIECKQNDKLN